MTIFPGQAGWPRAAPHTNWPILNDGKPTLNPLAPPMLLLPKEMPPEVSCPPTGAEDNEEEVEEVDEAVGEFDGDSKLGVVRWIV